MPENREFSELKREMTVEDRQILESHKGIVDGIALFMGPYCEVVLQSLEDPSHAVVKIANRHHTNREVGSAMTDHGIQVLRDYRNEKIQQTSCYTTMSGRGEPMRSVFTVILNDGEPIGLLGINFNMKVPFSEFMSTFSLFNSCAQLPDPELMKPVNNSVGDLIHNAVSRVVEEISTDTSIPNHEKNKYIVFGLHKNGIFDIKGSVMTVAKELHLSKFTIYSYIRELKEKKQS